MKFYMAVTADKYELPLAVAESPQELAAMRCTGTNNILSAISKGLSGKNTGEKYICVNDTMEYVGLTFIPDTRKRKLVY